MERKISQLCWQNFKFIYLLLREYNRRSAKNVLSKEVISRVVSSSDQRSSQNLYGSQEFNLFVSCLEHLICMFELDGGMYVHS
jgi:hypothetical protein